MATYSRPGVYIEESLNPLSDVAVDPAASQAAFVGVTSAGGPIGPLLITSWGQYQALFGGVSSTTGDLPYAVYSFFLNGGSGCWVVRALNDDATSAAVTLNDGAGTPVNLLTVTATAPGTWASDANSPSRVFVTVQNGSTGTNRFDLTIEVGTSSYLAVREDFVDLSLNPADPRYVLDVVNSPVVGSRYVTLTLAGGYTWSNSTPKAPATSTKTPLVGGSEGTGTPDLVAAAQRLDSVDRNLVINVPGVDATQGTSLVTWAAAGGRHFIVIDGPKPTAGQTTAQSVTALTALATGLPKSSHVALYGPWYYLADPGSKAGATRLTAPGGAVVGQMMRTDATRGVHKAPAGVNTQIQGSVASFHNFSNTEQDSLAAAGVNLIRSIPGVGTVIWGTRTQSQGMPDRYIPVRRLLIGLRSALVDITRFAVFEPNDEDLWATIEDVVNNYLQSQFDQGAFKGDSPDQAFYVICDDTNNTQATADAGVINIEVGVALKSPAEFILIRLGQQQAGSTVTDSLEDEV